jgi:fumarate hydratase class II
MEGAFRTERDSLGEMKVPAAAYYGPQTARAVENFPISGLRFPRAFIRALGLIKKHSVETNRALGLLPEEMAKAIATAAGEVAGGKWDGQFVVDIYQTGSGTSTNMNANEVISRRAEELLPDGARVHPNDHVNRGQSSNDVIPSALHIAAYEETFGKLAPALQLLERALQKKADEWKGILKVGRTHLQDATPLTVGQEFSGFAAQVAHARERLDSSQKHLAELALGGTAVGTGINTHPDFARRTIAAIAEETGFPFREAENHFEAQASRDAAVELSGVLKTIAVSLIKIANDIRLLGSGPRLGLGELKLPATQPGSSIMPGKVNPVMSEMLIQVACQVIGNDAAITFAGAFGQLQLNAMIPVIAHNLLQSIAILTTGCEAFATRCVSGLEVNEGELKANIEESLALAIALVPLIGYDVAARIAKEAEATNRTIREIAAEKSGLDPAALAEALDPLPQTGNRAANGG